MTGHEKYHQNIPDSKVEEILEIHRAAEAVREHQRKQIIILIYDTFLDKHFDIDVVVSTFREYADTLETVHRENKIRKENKKKKVI